MVGKSWLPEKDQLDIKLALWNGVPHKAIAAKYGVSAAYVDQVKSGRLLAAVPWPDTSTGAMSLMRRQELAKARKSATITNNVLSVSGSIASRETPSEIAAKIAEGDRLIELARENYLKQRAEEIQKMADDAREKAKHLPKVQPPPPNPPFKPSLFAHADWETINAEHEDLTVVKLAQSDPILQEAICIMFAAGLPESVRSGDPFTKLVADMKIKLDKYYEQHPDEIPHCNYEEIVS